MGTVKKGQIVEKEEKDDKLEIINTKTLVE